jgi:methionine biosynthesis protein MetW
LADSRISGQSGRSPIREVFGEMPLPSGIECFTMDYDRYWRDRISNGVITEPARRRARGILDLVKEGDSVLDVGCGTGETLEFLREKRGIRGTGLDVSSVALDIVKNKGFEAIRADLTRSDASLSGEWDHIILFELVEHIQEAEILISKLSGLFRKGLYITTPNLGYAAHRLRLLFGRFPVTYMNDPREHLRYWTVRDFRWWSRALGLPPPEVRGLRGKPNILGLPRRWPSLWASEVVYCFRR